MATPAATSPTKPNSAVPLMACAWPLSNPRASPARSEFRQTHRGSNPLRRTSGRGRRRLLDQGRAVDGDFVAEEAHFFVGHHEDGLVVNRRVGSAPKDGGKFSEPGTF